MAGQPFPPAPGADSMAEEERRTEAEVRRSRCARTRQATARRDPARLASCGTARLRPRTTAGADRTGLDTAAFAGGETRHVRPVNLDDHPANRERTLRGGKLTLPGPELPSAQSDPVRTLLALATEVGRAPSGCRCPCEPRPQLVGTREDGVDSLESSQGEACAIRSTLECCHVGRGGAKLGEEVCTDPELGASRTRAF